MSFLFFCLRKRKEVKWLNTVKNKRMIIYRNILVIVLVGAIVGVGALQYYEYYHKMPDQIKIKAGTDYSVQVNVPAKATIYQDDIEVSGFGVSNIPDGAVELDFSEAMEIVATKERTYTADVKLFGFIPLKKLEIEVVPEIELIPAGIPVGIYVKTNGVLVIGTGVVEGSDGATHDPSKNILQTDDYIQKVNDTVVSNKKEVIEALSLCHGEAVDLTIIRNEEEIVVRVVPVMGSDGAYKIGVWLRDSAQGIGTMTFVNEKGVFGALGHGINDIDTAMLVDMKEGSLYHTQIVAIHKGTKGEPGELTGSIDYQPNHLIGSIVDNTEKGIYGIGNKELYHEICEEPIPVGFSSEIQMGPAQILCNITGTPTYYDILIKELQYGSNYYNRSIVLEVVDEELIQLTGGIVQGMSGAPVLQNGKIIGAVTHVFVNDPTRGYGIFIENMLETAESVK